MRVPGGFFVVAFTLASCSGAREPTQQSPLVVMPAPSATVASVEPPPENTTTTPRAPVEAAPSTIAVASIAPSASAPSGPLPYPEEWIRQARGDNMGLSCLELVYKNGCSQTRTGIVTFEVTIDATGAVEKFSEVDNQIRNDKALVSRCLKKNLVKWKFHPPDGHLNTFQVSVALADRC